MVDRCIDTSYSCETKAAHFAGSRAETVFRMIEELLHNVERHAAANHVAIAIGHCYAEETMVVSVRDEGIGFDFTRHTARHYGLRGLREQATLIGAAFVIDPAPQPGVCATIKLPLSRHH
jgi:signal transduction histidine kinase